MAFVFLFCSSSVSDISTDSELSDEDEVFEESHFVICFSGLRM